jgi:hypothetical protein
MMACKITEFQRRQWKAEEEAQGEAEEISRKQQETRDRIRRGEPHASFTCLSTAIFE